MARRELAETNAGSMADIAFLLLVFFLVVTTMNADKGMTRLLPPPLIEPYDPMIMKERDVYEVMINLNNELFVEGSPMDVSQLRQGAKDFLISNGDNVLIPLIADKEDFPIRKTLDVDSINRSAITLRNSLLKLEDKKKALVDAVLIKELKNSIDSTKSALDKTIAKQYAFEFFGDYAALPPMALISVQNDNGTDYNTYVTINNELEAAIRELRDEVCLKKFGVAYDKLNSDNEEDKRKILAIRVLYPQRISEAEPLDAD